MNDRLWTPSEEKIKNAEMTKLRLHLNQKFNESLNDYKALYDWSVKNKELFWQEMFSYNNLDFSGDLNPALLEDSFENYTWFSNVKLSFAKNLLKNGNDNQVALNFVHENEKNNRKITYKDLKKKVGGLQKELKKYLKPSDVLAAYMPNIPETVIAMLAANSVGATFTSTSCDFGIEGVLDRFGQSMPKVLVACIGYEYGGKYFDLKNKLLEIEQKIPSLEKILIVDFLGKGVDLSGFTKAQKYSDILENDHLDFVEMPFSHPLYIMYSSGTTGKPKCIVHSQGGTLLQQVKEHRFHSDLTKEKTTFFFTTCGWMMWNWLVAGLALGSTVVLYEGSPAFPSPQYFFEMINREKINIFGTSPKFLKALEDTNTQFSSYPTLEAILSTGSPLLPEQFDFVYNKIKKDVLLGSISGGTDIVSCFMLACPVLPVYRGEIQTRGLGMAVDCFDENQESLVNKEGELVCTKTFPSRPIYFLDDVDKKKINAAYFDQNKGVWTHGDFVRITETGGVVVLGRSDATLNPGGVRIGTAEIYRQTENLSYIMDSLCVGRPVDGDVEVLLFVKMKEGMKLSQEHKKEIKDLIKKNTTPRHVPKEIIEVKDIPYTRSGKKVELAIARILASKPVTNVTALSNPESLEEYYQYKN